MELRRYGRAPATGSKLVGGPSPVAWWRALLPRERDGGLFDDIKQKPQSAWQLRLPTYSPITSGCVAKTFAVQSENGSNKKTANLSGIKRPGLLQMLRATQVNQASGCLNALTSAAQRMASVGSGGRNSKCSKTLSTNPPWTTNSNNTRPKTSH